MNRKSLLPALLLCAATVAASTAARADEPPLSDAAELERADQLFKEANAAFEAKDYKKARELYSQAYAIKQTYDIAGHLGLSEMELGLYRDAAEHLAASIRAAPPHQSKKRFEGVVQELERAKKEVATVFIEAPAGAKIFIDGREVGTAPIKHELFVETGRRRIEARVGDRVGVEEPDLTKGSTTKVALKVPGAENIGGDPDPVLPPEGRPSWPGWLLGGVGLASVGVGAALLGVGQAKVGSAEDTGASIEAQGGSCEPVAGPGSDQCQQGLDDLDSGDTLSTAGIVLLGTGGALLIGGVLYLVIPDGSDAEQQSVSVVPWAGPQGAGFVLQGEF